jgi:glycosyltransferase involved in cell wall biosynthesis
MYRHWSLINTDKIVAVSEFVANLVKSLEPRIAPKTEVIPTGVDTSRFAYCPPPTDDFLTLAWTARLDPIKQAEIAVEAVSRVPGVRLNLAGSGSERAKLEAMVTRLGVADRVHFLGYQSDIRAVLAGSHAVINCTREEGLPIALIEAASMGRAAIAFDGGGNPEVIEDRRTGWLAKDCSADAFAALIATANNNRKDLSTFGANARIHAEKRFSLEGMCRRYGAAYAQLTGAHAGARTADLS